MELTDVAYNHTISAKRISNLKIEIMHFLF